MGLLWFQKVGLACLGANLGVAFGALAVSVLTIVKPPANPKDGLDMKADPKYNGSTIYYILVVVAAFFMILASAFGLMLTLQAKQSENKRNKKFGVSFVIWLGTISAACMTNLIVGALVMGLVRLRDPDDELKSLFLIFSKYAQNEKFMSSFEVYQKQNSCCGIYGANDWINLQFDKYVDRQGVSAPGKYTYQPSPSTGKCSRPTSPPPGCGKKLLDDIQSAKTVAGGMLMLGILTGGVTIGFGVICFLKMERVDPSEDIEEESKEKEREVPQTRVVGTASQLEMVRKQLRKNKNKSSV